MIKSHFLLYVLLILVVAGAVACRPADPAVEPDSPDNGADEQPAAQPPSPTAQPAAATDAPAPAGGRPPLPPLVLNGSQPQGTEDIVGELTYDPDALLRIDAHRASATGEPGAGIASVEFRISSDADPDLYRFVDYAPAYCVFGGGEPGCASWPLFDGVFRWGEGGPPVEAGQYYGQAIFHEVAASDDGVEDSWTFTFEIAGR